MVLYTDMSRQAAQLGPVAPAQGRTQIVAADVIGQAVEALVGTVFRRDVPLMGAGLDSIAAVELVSSIG